MNWVGLILNNKALIWKSQDYIFVHPSNILIIYLIESHQNCLNIQKHNFDEMKTTLQEYIFN